MKRMDLQGTVTMHIITVWVISPKAMAVLLMIGLLSTNRNEAIGDAEEDWDFHDDVVENRWHFICLVYCYDMRNIYGNQLKMMWCRYLSIRLYVLNLSHEKIYG